MEIKKIIKLTLTIVILTIFYFIIKDNSYLIMNKIEYYYKKYFYNNIKQVLVDNEYKKNTNYGYLKINNETIIKNKEDIHNAIYTFLDAGWENYIVKCDVDYLNCINDVSEVIKNKTKMTNISNFVHPFNSFEKIDTTFNTLGKITFKKTGKYTDEQINEINNKVDEIYKNNYKSDKNLKENIKIFHDYIINNTKYDETIDNNSTNTSNSAYSVLIEGKGVCSGYADAMQLFLEKLNIKNYRITSSNHEWNLVFIEGDWLHLDLTWDDPVTNDNTDVLQYDYFLITTEELKNKTDDEHVFDENIYIEAK